MKIRMPVIVLAFFLLAAGTSLPYAHAEISMLNATVYANGMYVTVGFDGTLLRAQTYQTRASSMSSALEKLSRDIAAGITSVVLKK